MRTFLVAVAVLIGLANTLFFSGFGGSAWGGPFVWRLEPWPLVAAYALCAVFAGLVVSGAFLVFASRDLRGSFFARYGLMVLAMCLGGVLLSVLLSTVTHAFDDHLTVINRIIWALSRVPLTAVAGGVLGAAEGVILAFPLAAILGRFRTAG
jgi:hypothetical protein